MTTRWHHDGLHAGTRADPVVKHRRGITWHGRNLRRAYRSAPAATHALPLVPLRGTGLPVVITMIGNSMTVGR